MELTIPEYFKRLVDYGFMDLTHDPNNTAEHYWWANFVEDCMKPEPKEKVIYEKQSCRMRNMDLILEDIDED